MKHRSEDRSWASDQERTSHNKSESIRNRDRLESIKNGKDQSEGKTVMAVIFGAMFEKDRSPYKLLRRGC